MKAPDALLDRLRRGHRFLITSHINPDGDAVGSSLGLTRVLRKLGKSSVVWLRDPVPGLYSVLPGADRVHVGTDPPRGFPDQFDAVVVLECPSLERSGIADAVEAAALPVLNVDHHLGNEPYGHVNWVDTAAPAVGVLVHRIAEALHVDVDPATADCLYLALVTDTGGFRHSNATAQAFDAAAALVREGAGPDKVAQWLYESRPESAVRLQGAVLQTLELHDDGQVATVHVDHDMVAAASAQPGDSEGLIDIPRSIAGVRAVALFRQLEDRRWKASLRSRGEVSVERVARRHGGGGHQNAAGFTAEPDRQLGGLRSEVVQELGEAIRLADHAAAERVDATPRDIETDSGTSDA
ncbi:MAG: bifunctional oligoribonuclease/PAP phosphatase NrnA [Thermoanaerobaculia bacterium]|nr:bifunctional oligoribonuclease/PAP phosphatase NrnA [Thermoanaerobaculia bacterium]